MSQAAIGTGVDFVFGNDAWQIEIPAGYVDEGEPPIESAQRELVEETRIQAKELRPIHEFWVSPGVSTDYIHSYLAIVDSSQCQTVAGLASEGEDIYVFSSPFDRVQTWILEGKINNTSGLLMMYWLAANRDRLLQEFSQ